MKNKKGFTLIELLAVIVVLAIIALITTPIVMNTIKNAKKGAAERSADNYVKAVEQKVAESRIDGTKIANGNYNIQADGNLCPTSGCGENDKDKITIDMSGNKPTSGTVTISNGGVSQNETIMIVDGYDVIYKDNKYTAVTIVYSWSTNKINIENIINPNDTSKFTKDASTLGKNYYLKHVLDKDNKVTESYVCAILKSKEYCLTIGEYGYARNSSDYKGNALFLKTISDAKIEGISCSFDAQSSGCYSDGVGLEADAGGYVDVRYDFDICTVEVDGGSICASN